MVEDLAAAARESLAEGDLSGAERQAGLALRQDPSNVAALIVIGRVEAATGRLAQAERTLQGALRISPKDAGALNALSITNLLQGRVHEAIQVAERVLAIDSQDSDAYANLGAANIARKRFDLAVEVLKKAVELAPENGAYRHDLGLALQMIGAEKAAEAQFREAIRLDPASPLPFAKLGRILRLRSDAEGELLYQRALDASFDRADRLTELARGLSEEEEPVWAVKVLRRALELQPENDFAHALLGRMLTPTGAFEEAQSELDTAIQLRPTASRPYVDKVYMKRVGESDLPLVQAMQALVMRPDLTLDDRRNFHYALGKSFEDLGQYDQAIRHYDEANGIMQLLSPGGALDRAALSEWYKRLTRVFTRQTMSRMTAATDSDKPIFIVGMIRSGTTLVEQLLSNHPEVGAGGEITYLFRAYSVLIRETGIDTKLAVPFAERYLRILSGRAPGTPRATDKMPRNFAALGIISALMPNARIIHVRRQPIDNALAIYVTPFTEAIEFAHSKEDIVFFYRAYQRLMAHWREVLPADRFLEVDYEAIVSEPEPNVRRMVEFCGLPWSENCLRPDLNQAPILTPSAWQARQPIFRTSVDRWRRFEPWLGPLRELLDSPEIEDRTP